MSIGFLENPGFQLELGPCRAMTAIAIWLHNVDSLVHQNIRYIWCVRIALNHLPLQTAVAACAGNLIVSEVISKEDIAL